MRVERWGKGIAAMVWRSTLDPVLRCIDISIVREVDSAVARMVGLQVPLQLDLLACSEIRHDVSSTHVVAAEGRAGVRHADMRSRLEELKRVVGLLKLMRLWPTAERDCGPAEFIYPVRLRARTR